jgi:hypothetical protein
LRPLRQLIGDVGIRHGKRDTGVAMSLAAVFRQNVSGP